MEPAPNQDPGSDKQPVNNLCLHTETCRGGVGGGGEISWFNKGKGLR